MPSFRDLLDPGIEAMSLMSPELAEGFFTTSATRPLPQYSHIINTQIYDNCGYKWFPTGTLGDGKRMEHLTEIWEPYWGAVR